MTVSRFRFSKYGCVCVCVCVCGGGGGGRSGESSARSKRITDPTDLKISFSLVTKIGK